MKLLNQKSVVIVGPNFELGEHIEIAILFTGNETHSKCVSMESNDVSIAVKEILEGMISIVTNQAASISDEISPLTTTPRVRKNTTPTSRDYCNTSFLRKRIFLALELH